MLPNELLLGPCELIYELFESSLISELENLIFFICCFLGLFVFHENALQMSQVLLHFHLKEVRILASMSVPICHPCPIGELSG